MPAKDFKEYAAALDNASMLAQRDLALLWDKVRGLPPEEIRDALIELVPGIVYKYGNMAALAAAEYYETERAAAGGGYFSAELSEGIPIEQIEASVRYACGHLFSEEGDDGARSESDASLFGGQG